MVFLKIIYHLKAIIKKTFFKIIFGKHITFGKGSTFRKGFSIAIEEDGIIKIGKNVYFNNFCSINSLCSIEIGDDCIFGENVRVYDHNHKFSKKTEKIMKQGYSKGPIKIGSDCWIGSNVTILKGVNIGDNVIIGAGSIIDKDIPSNFIVKPERNLVKEERI